MQESSLRARRRKKRFLVLFFVSLFFFLASAGVILLSQAAFLRITNIAVSGAKTVSAVDIQKSTEHELAGNYLFFFPKNDVLLYPKNAVMGRLLTQFPALKSVEILAGTPANGFNTLAISVAERQQVALWCGENVATSSQCFFIDDDGVVFAPAADFSGNIYKKYYGVFDPRQFHSLSALVTALAEKIDRMVQSVFINAEKDVHLKFENNFTLIFALDGADVYKHFILAISADVFKKRAISDFEYLDLRFGNKLYYKLR